MNLLSFFVGYFNAIYDVREKVVWFSLYCLYSLCFRWYIVLMFDKEWIVFRIVYEILQIIGFLHFRLSFIIVEFPLFVLWLNNFEGNSWFIELPVNHLLWVWARCWWLWDVINDDVVSFCFLSDFIIFAWLKCLLDVDLCNVLMIFLLSNRAWVTLSALSDQRE